MLQRGVARGDARKGRQRPIRVSGRVIAPHPLACRPRGSERFPNARARPRVLHASRLPPSAARALARSARTARQAGALPMVTLGWLGRRALVALAFYLAAYGLDPVWPSLGIPWAGPRFLLGGACGLLAAWLTAALPWALRAHQARREAWEARVRGTLRTRAEALGLAAVRRALLD